MRHDPRRRGTSRYGLLQLVLLNLDLITSFTTAPLLWMFAAGAALAAAASAAAVLGLLPRPAWSLVLVLGTLLAASGLVGLYVARLYRLVAGGRRLHVVRRGPARSS